MERSRVRCAANEKVRSAEDVRAGGGASHQPHRKYHVENMWGRIPPETWIKVKVSIRRRPERMHRLEIRRRPERMHPPEIRRRPERRIGKREDIATGTRRHRMLAEQPPRYPQVGNTVEGDGFEGIPKPVLKGVASPIPPGRKDCGGRRVCLDPSRPSTGTIPDTRG